MSDKKCCCKISNKIKKIYNRWSLCRCIGSIGIILVTSVFIIEIFFDLSDIVPGNASLIILTALIVYVAWVQLSGMSKTAKSDFLLRIDERYNSKEILRARTIINNIRCKIKKGNSDKEELNNEIAKKIMSMRDEEGKSEEYISLENYLSLLETIAYFTNEEHLSSEEFEKLLGEAIIGDFIKFKELISYYIKKDKYAYSELITLVHKMSCPDCRKDKNENKGADVQEIAYKFIRAEHEKYKKEPKKIDYLDCPKLEI